MQEFQQVIAAETTRIVESGELEGMIKTHLNSLVDAQIKDCLRSYGPFGKALTEKINESLGIAMHHIKIPEYNIFIKEVVSEAFGEVLQERGAERLQELIADIVDEAPKQMTSQELLDKVRHHWEEEGQENGAERIEIEFNRSEHGGVYIEFKNPGYGDESITLTLYDHQEKEADNFHIGYIREGKSRGITRGVGNATRALGLAGYFYKLYALGTSIHIDEDLFDDGIYIGRDY